MPILTKKIQHLLSLRFEDEELEKAFHVYAFEESLVRVRWSLLLAMLLYAAFGILDGQMIPEVKHEAWVIRYLVFCPLVFAVIVISYFKIFQRICLICLASLGFVGGAGILAMIALGSPPGSDFYYAGLLLTSMFYFVFLRLNFFVATALAWIIFCLYVVTAIFMNGVSTPVLINNTFFFFSFNITGMLACYSMERYLRLDFIQRREITEQKEKLGMIFENSPIGILHFDSHGVITACNRTLAEIIGSPRERLVGLNMISDLNNDFLIAAVKKALLGGTGNFEGEYVSVTAGKAVMAKVSFRPVISSQGKVLGGVGIVEDISDRHKTYEALRISELKFRMLFDNAPIGIMLVDIDGEVLDGNRAAMEILGLPLSETTKSINALSCPLFVEAGVSASISACMTEGKPISSETAYTSKRGKQSHLRLLITPRLNEGANIDGCQALVEDISIRKTSEIALQESENRFRAVLESSPDPVVVYDKEGNVTYLNPAFEQTFGWSQDELLGKRIEYVPEDEVARSMDTIRMLYDGAAVSSFETRRLTKDGTCLDITISAALVRDRAGNPTGNMITLRDITQQKLVDKELKSSEERYRLLIESSPIGIGIVQNGKYVYANSALTGLLGCDGANEIVGQSPMTFMTDEVKGMFFEKNPDNLEPSELIQNHETRGLKKNGERFDASVWSRHIDFQGMPAILSFVVDVTQEKSLRTQLFQSQKMEAIGTLAGGVAHDFNNLLQAVIGYSEVILFRKEQSDRDWADIQKICEAGKRGAELVKSLLMFSQKIEPRHVPVDLNQEILQIQNLLTHTIPKTIRTDLDLSGDLKIIYADPNQLGQILLNLAVNARDAMPEGGTLTISTANSLVSTDHGDSSRGVKKGLYVVLTVSDSGYGIDDELIPHIFEPFFTTKEVGKGTGLGLATVYGIVKQHNGHITCDSSRATGTTFNVYLPALDAETDPEDSTVETPLIGGNETVLLVEDEDLVRDLGSEILANFGYDVVVAENGKQALDIYQEHKDRISLVILDLIMPEMDGRRCLKKILQMDRNARVLIASGYSEDISLDDDIMGSARGFIRKPYDMRTLLQMVREILDEGSLNSLTWK
jgi:two-component system, cell cycle sensor histidine kinase and response regulator CckA